MKTLNTDRLASLATWALPLVIGLIFAAAHMPHNFWHDELYTLLFFSQTPLQPLRDYHLPNNHILFSMLLSLWRIPTDHLYWLRMLPMLAWIASLILTSLAVTRLVGRSTGLLAGLMLATSHAALNIAVELRGYSLSAAFASLGLYALTRDGRRWAFIYALAGAAAVATIPINLATFATLAVIFVLLRHAGMIPAKAGAIWQMLSPLAGLIVYIPVLHQLRDSLAKGLSGPFTTLAWEWPTATLGDYLWLAPLLTVSLWLAVRRRASWFGLAALAATLIVPLAATLPLTRKPTAYNFSPMLPILYASFALALAPALQWLERWRGWKTAITTLIAIALIVLGSWREATDAGYWQRAQNNTSLHNLYDQWFQSDYRIVEAAQRASELLQQSNTVLIVGDRDPLTFLFHARSMFSPEANANLAIRLTDAETKPAFQQFILTRKPRILLIADSDADAHNILRRLDLESHGTPQKTDDFGSFKIYKIQPPQKD
ncbi:MAG: hypothetical protein FWD53_02815 [Phycisphaerales bacterium]|nr:hypothetical protein [Phycisphaerales bacterium]